MEPDEFLPGVRFICLSANAPIVREVAEEKGIVYVETVENPEAGLIRFTFHLEAQEFRELMSSLPSDTFLYIVGSAARDQADERKPLA